MKGTASVLQGSKIHRGAFRSERELQAELANLELDIEGPYSITFRRREVPVGPCIPDLIYVRFAQPPDPLLWPRRWTFRHSFALWLLRQDATLTLGAMADLFYESPDGRIKQTMRDLVRSGAVIENPSQTFGLSPAMRAVRAEVIAVEVKLSRWTRALEQAQSYLSFADRSFVAMDARQAPKRSNVLDKFLELGIGLCVVLPRSLEWLVMPQPDKGLHGCDREYLIASAASKSRQTLWSAL